MKTLLAIFLLLPSLSWGDTSSMFDKPNGRAFLCGYLYGDIADLSNKIYVIEDDIIMGLNYAIKEELAESITVYNFHNCKEFGDKFHSQ